jgi:hypothetical protein
VLICLRRALVRTGLDVGGPQSSEEIGRLRSRHLAPAQPHAGLSLLSQNRPDSNEAARLSPIAEHRSGMPKLGLGLILHSREAMGMVNRSAVLAFGCLLRNGRGFWRRNFSGHRLGRNLEGRWDKAPLGLFSLPFLSINLLLPLTIFRPSLLRIFKTAFVGVIHRTAILTGPSLQRNRRLVLEPTRDAKENEQRPIRTVQVGKEELQHAIGN